MTRAVPAASRLSVRLKGAFAIFYLAGDVGINVEGTHRNGDINLYRTHITHGWAVSVLPWMDMWVNGPDYGTAPARGHSQQARAWQCER